MAPGPSPEPLGFEERLSLLRIARASIEHGLREGRALRVEPDEHPAVLRAERASFVTLRIEGELRGCTGRLEAVTALVVDVANSAWGSAFADPRFPRLKADELAALEIHIAVLSPLESLPVDSESDLLAKLRRGRDGLVLHDGASRSTFLPAVWDSLPAPEDFLRELKKKAGLPENYWSPSLRFERYTALDID